jgi:hypothetical protein
VCAYDHLELLKRQVCWAHVKRNWEKMLERGGKAKAIAESCLRVQQRVFEHWHLFRGGGCSRSKLVDETVPLMLELLELLHKGKRCRDRKTKRFCKRLLGVYPALWTFVAVESVEPTNNHVERAQRRAVLWRRRSFGCHSAAGCRFVERILTVVQTLRLQRRSVRGHPQHSQDCCCNSSRPTRRQMIYTPAGTTAQTVKPLQFTSVDSRRLSFRVQPLACVRERLPRFLDGHSRPVNRARPTRKLLPPSLGELRLDGLDAGAYLSVKE